MQYIVGSDRISTSSDIKAVLVGMKKVQSKVKALECSQPYTLIFRRSKAGNSVRSGPIF